MRPENLQNLNYLIPKLSGSAGWIRVTLDPTASRIISAGIMRAGQVANLIASGQFVPF